MPNYDYYCPSCDQTFEVFQKITEDPLQNCVSCGNQGFERKIGGGQTKFHFKGQGFYITDYCKNTSSSCSCKDS